MPVFLHDVVNVFCVNTEMINLLPTKSLVEWRQKQNLTCADYGEYVPTCQLCLEQCVGQTISKFLTRRRTQQNL